MENCWINLPSARINSLSRWAQFFSQEETPEVTQGRHSIQGSWRGRYFYAGDGTAHGFEAVFIELDGIIEGNILDDGQLGEATVGGKFNFPHVKFTKCYRTPGTDPVNYQGMMSEDGKTISGRWTIQSAVSGTWTASRYEDGEDLDMEDLENLNKELVEDKPKVLTSPGVSSNE